MKLETFISHLRDAVRFSNPNEQKHEQLQTFAVIRSMADVNTSGLDKNIADRYRPYFYSRKWEQLGHPASNLTFEYPACFAILLTTEGVNLFDKDKKQCTAIQLNFVYPNYHRFENYDPSVMCKRLTTDEIYNLMGRHSLSVIRYLDGIVNISETTPAQYSGYLHKGFLDQAISENTINSYTEDRSKSRSFQMMIRQENPKVPGGFIDDEGDDKLCGQMFTIRFCSSECDTFTYTFKTEDCCSSYD